MEPVDVIYDYYEALESGEALTPYFRESPATIKFGIGEALFGYETVAAALREQTATTTDWTIESHGLTVDVRGDRAVFADEVTMAWSDVETDTERRFDSRWSGCLDRVDDAPPWQFAVVHVSAPQPT